MKTDDFMARLDHRRIEAAIAAAEANTSGEIRVYVQRGKVADDPLKFATAKFHELGMTATRERNAVLILVAPRAQKFAVVGDEGIHRKCGEEFWQQLVATMRGHFQREAFTDALIEGIGSVGQLLAQHFPPKDELRGELPNTVVEG